MPRRRPERPIERLRRRVEMDDLQAGMIRREEAELRKPFRDRVLRPLIQGVKGFTDRAVTGRQLEVIRQKLARAGYPGGFTASEFAALKTLLSLFFPATGLLTLMGLRQLMGMRFPLLFYFLVSLALAITGYLSVDFYLNFLVRRRRNEIARSVPDVLDLLTITVEAGLGLDQALDRVGQRFRGPLGDELVRVVQEMRMGRPRGDAFRDLADRTGVEELHAVATAIIQADRLGVSIGNVLRAQSEQLRQMRLMRVREQAQKAPTKMMIPLVLFIFPALFIVLFGPAAIRAWHTLRETPLFGGGGP